LKPSPFDYLAPASVEDAIAMRASYEDSVILAGGQSLIPALNFRLAQTDAVIDIGRIPGLDKLDLVDGVIRVGAMVRARQLELSEEAYAANPLLREALHNVAHVPIRNRGTVCGSLAHADAAAEMPTVLVALGGTVTVQGPGGERDIAAEDLFLFHMTTSLAPDELMTAARFPVLPQGAGYAFEELTRRHGDYAVAGICAVVTLDSAGNCDSARLAACGIAEKPVRLFEVEAGLVGTDLGAEAVAAAARAVEAAVSNEDDGAGGKYRRQVARTLVGRAVAKARLRIGEGRA
jgi:CO/xanthine dehydrogenase FAD-binding subunit